MKTHISKLQLLGGLFLMAGALVTQAQVTQIKTNNATALDLGTSWTSGTAPGSGDIGEWTSAATATGDLVTLLGGAYAIGELQIVNPAGEVYLSDTTSGHTLTLNGATGTGVGVDMSAATQNLLLGAPLVIGANQTWKIVGGKSLVITNGIAFGANTITITGSGTINNSSGVYYEPDQALVVPTTSIPGGGLNINGASFIDFPEAGSGVANHLGIYTSLTMTPSAAAFSYYTLGTAANAGNSTEIFSNLTLNPGTSLFYVDGRASSSGDSVGFARVNRNGGGIADFQEGSIKSGNGFGGNANSYALPGTTVNGYATTSQNDWALPAGSNTLLAVSTYVSDTWASGNNTTVTGNETPASGSTINSLRFGAAVSPTITLSGANIITSGGILANSTVAANTVTITGGSLTSGNANADGTSDLIVINNTASSGNIIISTVIANNGSTPVGLTVGTTSPTAPSGSVELGGANTFSGATYVTKGVLLLNNSLALQDSTYYTGLPGTLNFGSLASATLAGLAGSGSLALPSGFALTVGNNNASSTLNGALSGSGSVTKVGTGTWTLNGVNGYTGGTTISAGTLALGAAGALSGSTAIGSGATLDVSAAGNYALAASVSGLGAINGSLTLTNGGQLAASTTTGTLALNNSLTINGGTILVNFNGATHGVITVGANLTVSGGSVQVNNTGAALADGTYKIIGVPGTITGSGSVLSVSGFAQTGQAAAVVANAGELDLVVTTYIAQNLTWVGDGSGSGLWNVNGDADWFDNTSSSTSVFHNGDNTTFNDTSANPTVNLSATLSPLSVTVNSTANSYVFQGSGSIGGSATLADNGSGPLTVLTVNSYSGGTTIASGATVNVGNGTTAGSLGSGAVADNSALTYDLPTGSQTQGAISGSGTLTVTGAGTVVLNGADTLSGATTITSGSLKQGVANALPSAGPVVVNGSLLMGGLSGTVNNLTGTGTINNTVAGSPILTVTGGGDFGGLIEDTTGSLGLTVNGAGTTLEVTNATYTGLTTVTDGTLQLGSATALPGGSVSVGSAGVLDVNSFSPTIDVLTGAGVVDDVAGGGTVTFTLGNNGGSGTFSGIIQNSSGTISLAKNGAGTETLTGDNSYSGTTTVNAGTLTVGPNGVINGTTLGGAGFVVAGGSVTTSGTSTLGDGVAFLETSGTVNAAVINTPNDSAGSATIEITGGSFTAASITLPRVVDYATAPTAAAPIAANQVSGLYIDGSTANVNLGTLSIGTANSSASVRMDAGTLALNGELEVSHQVTEGRWSVFQVNGGFFTESDTANGIVIAPDDGTTYDDGEVYFSGPSTNAVGIINFGAAGDTVAGGAWLFVNGGADLYIGSGGIQKPGVNANEIELTSGLLGASASWSSPMSMNLNGTNFTLQPSDPNGTPYDISLSGALTVTATSGLTISGFPNGSGGSGGTVYLSGANQYNGGTLVTNSATLNINGIYALGGANYAGLTLNGGTLQYTNLGANGSYDLTTGAGVTLGALGGAIDVNGNSVTYAGELGNGGAGSLTVLSTSVSNGVLNLLAPSAYTGGTTIGNNNIEQAGNGILDVSNTTGSATGPGNVTVAFGGTLTGNGMVGGAVEVKSGGLLNPGCQGAGITTVGALQLDSGSVTIAQFSATTNSSTLVTTPGGFVINDGSDNAAFALYGVGGTSPVTTPGAYKLVNFSGAAPALDASWTTVSGTNPHIANPQPTSIYSFAISGNYLTVTVAGNGLSTASVWTNTAASGNWSVAANWSSNPNVPHLPGDTATLGDGAAFSTVTLNAAETIGTLTFNNNNSYAIANDGFPLKVDNTGLGATIYVTAGSANSISAPVALNDNVTVNLSAGQSLSVPSVISSIANSSLPNDTETLNVTGSGTLALTGNNTYGPAAGTVGTTVSGPAILQVGGSKALSAGDVSFTASGTLAAGAANLYVSNNVTSSSGVTVTVNNNGDNVVLAGNVSGQGGLYLTGNGTVALTNNNSYSGNTALAGGVLSLTAQNNLGGSPNLDLLGGDLLGNGTFSLGINVNVGPATGGTGGTALIDAASGQQFTIAGVIAPAGNTGANGLVVNSGAGNNGTVILVNANTFNGSTVVSNGVLDLQYGLALQDSTLNYNGQGGTLVFDNVSTATFGGLSGAQNLALTNLQQGPVALTVGGNNSSGTYSGNLTDAGLGGGLSTAGTGTLTLTGTNNYGGNTTVGGGVLQITNGSVICGAVSVNLNSGGELIVNGGTLVATNTSTIAAGTAAVGLLVAAGSATFQGALNTSDNQDTVDLIETTGGSLTAASMALGRSGTIDTAQPTAGATADGLYVDGGSVNILGNLDMSSAGNNESTVSARIDAGSLTVGGEVIIGLNNGGRWSVLDVNGGSLTVTNDITGISVGAPDAGDAEFLIRAGTASVGIIGLGNGTTADTAVLNQTGGSLYVGAGGIVQVSPNVSPVITLADGLLGATASWACTNAIDLDGTNEIIQTADASGNPWSISLTAPLSGSSDLTVTGTGTLTLSGVNTCTGSTIVSNGVLALTNNAVTFIDGSIATSTNITIASGAVLDVSGISTTTLALGSGQVLNGGGAIRGKLSAAAGSLVAPGGGAGGSTAALTVTNSVHLAGSAVFNLNRTNAQPSDEIISPAVTAGGTLTVENTGAGLHAGDTFHLFSTAVAGSFASVTLPAVDLVNNVTYTWTNQLAVNGTIAVLTSVPNVNTNPTNIMASVAGDVLTLSWPADHTGWRLQVQTNNLALGLSSNSNDWGTVTGSTSTNQAVITINPAQPAAYYRMVYP